MTTSSRGAQTATYQHFLAALEREQQHAARVEVALAHGHVGLFLDLARRGRDDARVARVHFAAKAVPLAHAEAALLLPKQHFYHLISGTSCCTSRL